MDPATQVTEPSNRRLRHLLQTHQKLLNPELLHPEQGAVLIEQDDIADVLLLLQRALRYAERAPRAAARRPVPATKMMVAMLQARSRRDLPNDLAVISPPISP